MNDKSSFYFVAKQGFISEEFIFASIHFYIDPTGSLIISWMEFKLLIFPS